jgi:ubiquitin carboxyl-terminal hydrolase L3
MESVWVPLESNPEVWSEYSTKLGVSHEWLFTDIFGLDADLLGMVPQPATAVLMLFPVSETVTLTLTLLLLIV